MCGRFRTEPWEAVEIMGVDTEKVPGPFTRERRPGELVAIRTATTGTGPGRRLARWGYPVSFGNGMLLHARGETALAKPTFAKAAASRRCLVRADAWWEKGRRLELAGEDPWTWLAAIAGVPDPTGAFPIAIVTRGAWGAASAIHHRCPAPLGEAAVGAWLGDDPQAAFGAALAGEPELLAA